MPKKSLSVHKMNPEMDHWIEKNLGHSLRHPTARNSRFKHLVEIGSAAYHLNGDDCNISFEDSLGLGKIFGPYDRSSGFQRVLLSDLLSAQDFYGNIARSVHAYIRGEAVREVTLVERARLAKECGLTLARV